MGKNQVSSFSWLTGIVIMGLYHTVSEINGDAKFANHVYLTPKLRGFSLEFF